VWDRDKFGELLGVPAEEVKPEKRITDLGIDSLMSTEIKVIKNHIF
jgi:acyl carrier protein